MNFGWKVISGYFIGYLLVYFLTHWTWDILMLLKQRGKAHYPYPKSQNFFGIICFCLSTISFWIFLVIIPIRSIVLKADTYTSLIFLDGTYLWARFLGMVLMSFGLIVGVLGRWARGFYQADNILKLQTRLGFAFTRHPNYFQYICGFLGLPFLSLHLGTILISIFGIYGYYIFAREEERSLLLEFGDAYRKYQDKVGMFFPKICKINSSNLQLISYTSSKRKGKVTTVTV